MSTTRRPLRFARAIANSPAARQGFLDANVPWIIIERRPARVPSKSTRGTKRPKRAIPKRFVDSRPRPRERVRQRIPAGPSSPRKDERPRWVMPEAIGAHPDFVPMGGFRSARTGETDAPPPDDISGTIPTHTRVADCESAERPRRFSRPVVHDWARENRNRANEHHPARARRSPSTRRCETKPPGFGEAWWNMLIPKTSRTQAPTPRLRDRTNFHDSPTV